MRHHLLASAAAAVLTVSLATAQAQQTAGERDRAPSEAQQQESQKPSGSKGERARERAPAAQRAPDAVPQRGADREGQRSTTTGQGSPDASQQQRQSGTDAQREGQPKRESAQDRQPRREGARDSQRRDNAQQKQRRDNARNSAQQKQRRDAQQDRQQRGAVRDRGTTGQATRESGEPPRSRDAQRSRDGAAGATAQGEIRTDSSVSLSQQQSAQISTRFAARIDRMNVQRISRSDLNVSISVGAVLPASVRYYPVPADIVAIYPRFRGYRFVVVEEEIVIVEPRSYRVVAVLPYGGGRVVERGPSTTGSAAAEGRIRLSAEARQRIRTVVLREPICRQEVRFDIFIAIPIPRTVEICEFPQDVVAEVPEVRSYRYLVRDDDIVIVDPRERRVVEVID